MRFSLVAGIVAALALFAAACGGGDDDAGRTLAPLATGPLIGIFPPSLQSKAFVSGGTMPLDTTCDGGDRSPPLSWFNIRADAQSLALDMVDPDARGFTHWLVYDIPPEVVSLPGGVPQGDTLENGVKQGKNSFGDIGYGGPCPPKGSEHEYRFRLYALDIPELGLDSGASANDFHGAIENHILALSELAATYKR